MGGRKFRESSLRFEFFLHEISSPQKSAGFASEKTDGGKGVVDIGSKKG